MELGKKAVDGVTGFAGTVTARIEYLGGETQYLLENAFDCKAHSEWVRASRIVPASEPAAA